MNVSTDSKAATATATPPAAEPSREAAIASREPGPTSRPPGPEGELAETRPGESGLTLPGGQVDMTTGPGPMATTNIEALPTGRTHPPGMVTTLRPAGMMTTALGTLDGAGGGSRASSLTPGTLIDGKYRLEAMLGKGGMGIVWRAEHAHLHGSVAIKFLLDRFRAKPQVIERFWQEATVMGELGHPNIVRVHDISPASAEMPYITMELLQQGSLREYLKKSGGTLPPDEAVELMDGVLSALIAAHKRGIVHRDIKPDNLMLATMRSFETDLNEVQLKILDFGASLLLDNQSDINTAEGLLGTPYYMSPEQASGAQLDQRSDLYSTAVVLYELVSGKLPHTAEDVHSLVYAIATEEARPIEQHAPNLTRGFREFFQRALAMDPKARYQTAEDMREGMRKLSKKLSGKVRNTALYMASGDTGPLAALTPERPDSRPMRSFRASLDEPRPSETLPMPPQPSEPSLQQLRQRRFPVVAAIAAVVALAPALALQSSRFGGLARAPVIETLFAWIGCAGVAVFLAWRVTHR
ncbi:MAG: serine/threonine protein kinase [Myxococcales bacterium]|nr:serine/threonine protein kinase [Myxococcales bacterium]